MIKRRHSKLCRRRMSSRSTLVSENRHSTICIRDRGQRLRHRLHSVFNILRKEPRRKDYFTGQLPAEIRLSIYRYALWFGTPIILNCNPRHGQKTRLAGILVVNRRVYAEALPILYELNTIVISREEFCRYLTGKRPQLTVKPELVQQLYIRDLGRSTRCSARAICPHPARLRPCRNCDDSLVGFINTLRLKPRLKRSIHRLPQPLLRISRTGYRPELCGDMLRGMKFELHDVPMVEVWRRIMELPARYPYAAGYRADLLIWRDLRRLEPKTDMGELAALIVNIRVLLISHDAGFVPPRFANIWPQDVPMDFRTVEALARPELLHDMNVQLLGFLESGPLLLTDFVARRT